MTEIYERISKLLTDRHLRKIDLVRETGIPESTFRSWQRGIVPTVINAYKVCNFLNVPMEYLITGELPNDEQKIQLEPKLRLSYMEEQLINRFNHLDERDRDVLLSLADVMQNKYRGIYKYS